MPTKLVKPGLEIYNGDSKNVKAYDECHASCDSYCAPPCSIDDAYKLEIYQMAYWIARA
jgi:hypothetical protein